MTKSILFIHGAWVTPKCWDPFKQYFETLGYTCTAPAWPHRQGTISEQRTHPDPALANLGIKQIVDYYAQIIQTMPEPPILIGHSFGGLFVQMLLDKGLGAAGVSIDPAPPKGVNPFLYPSIIKSNLWILLTWRGWKKILNISRANFNYAFVNTLTPEQQTQVYDYYVVPETGKIFFQSAVAMFTNTIKVNFNNPNRAPLLITSSSEDNIVTAGLNKTNYDKYVNSPAGQSGTVRTDYHEFPDRTHWVIAMPGWQEVAEYVKGWMDSLTV